MRAKKLGRHKLLSWINGLTQSDYSRIENLSDGIGFCQIIDAFHANTCDLYKLKMNSKSLEDWEENFNYLNFALVKIKSHRKIDPLKLSKSTFSVNFEFLQFLFDMMAKSFGDPFITGYNGYQKRLDIIKSQNGGKISDIKKFLPTHLIPNEYLLKMDRQRYFGEGLEKGIFSEKFNPLLNKINAIGNNEQENQFLLKNNFLNNQNIISDSNNNSNTNNYNIDEMIEKYKNYFKILQEDLTKSLERNKIYSQEISDIEEERNYYMIKLENVLRLSESILSYHNISNETCEMMSDIIKIITHIPEDFK